MALDANGDGVISVEELNVLLRTLRSRLQMSDREIKKFEKELDKDGDGTIDIEEFFSMIQCGKKSNVIQRALIQRSGIRKMFEKYDKDGNGVITRDEFRRVVEDKYQTRLDPDQIDAMIMEADRNGDGEIDYDEFLKAFTYFPAKK